MSATNFPTVVDRSVETPSRVRLTPVSGDVYDMTIVPGTVTQEGTVIDKELFDSIRDDTVWNIDGGGTGATTAAAARTNLGVPSATDFDVLSDDFDEHLEDTDNPHEVTKSQVGLGNVDNTSDVNKPISTATQTAITNEQNARIAADTDLSDDIWVISNQLNTKVSISDIVDSLTSTATDKPLSANKGKTLQDEIENLQARGRFLSLWNCATGLPTTEPESLPYAYKTGDYFVVGTVGTTNYEPTGSSYTGAASTVVETSAVAVNDTYIYDGTTWKLLQNTEREVSFANLVGQPTDNSNLAAALNAKQDDIGITIVNNQLCMEE